MFTVGHLTQTVKQALTTSKELGREHGVREVDFDLLVWSLILESDFIKDFFHLNEVNPREVISTLQSQITKKNDSDEFEGPVEFSSNTLEILKRTSYQGILDKESKVSSGILFRRLIESEETIINEILYDFGIDGEVLEKFKAIHFFDYLDYEKVGEYSDDLEPFRYLLYLISELRNLQEEMEESTEPGVDKKRTEVQKIDQITRQVDTCLQNEEILSEDVLSLMVKLINNILKSTADRRMDQLERIDILSSSI